MNPDNLDLDDELADQLVALDEALAAGTAIPNRPVEGGDSDQRLARGLVCLKLLRQVHDVRRGHSGTWHSGGATPVVEQRSPEGGAADSSLLGAVLYELLTGHAPFQGDTPFDTLQQVVANEPVRPSRLRPSIPRDPNVQSLASWSDRLPKELLLKEARAKILGE